METYPQFSKPVLSEDTQSNGFVERAVRSIEEMVRTHKIALEAKIGGKLKINHSAIG